MLKIHVGCGKRYWPGWYNVDGGDFPHVKDNDITLTKFLKKDVDLIYACHFLEYFDRDDAATLLKLWHMALKPGGILRLAVPDFDNMALAIQHYDFDLKDILGPLYGKIQMGEKTIYHKTVYNYSHLKSLLSQAGFFKVHRYDWRETDHAQFDDCSQAYLPKMDKANGICISLNVEAIK